MKQKIEIIAGGIFGMTGELPIGTMLEVGEIPAGWASKVRVVSSGAAEGAVALTGTDRDENGDTPEMADMRRQFNAAYDARLAELEAERAKVADLTAQLDALTAPPPAGYAVTEKSSGWFVVTKDGEAVTKALRQSALEGFDAMDDAAKAAFVEDNKPE